MLAHDRAPGARLLARKFAQLLGRGEHQVHLLGLGELAGGALLAQALDEGGAEALDDRLRRAARRVERPPGGRGGTRIAAFGSSTCQAVVEAGLRLDIEAPTPQAPSMKMALEAYIKKANK